MVSRSKRFFEDRFGIRPQQTGTALRVLVLLALAVLFALCCTVVLSFDDVLLPFSSRASLGIGNVPAEDIVAREEGTFISAILTEQERAQALAQVSTAYNPADPNIARQQRDLVEQILNYIDHIRADSYATLEQQISDIRAISALQFDADDATIIGILELPEESWQLVRDEIVLVLERVMSDEIRSDDLSRARRLLPNQVSLRMTEQQSQIVTDITSDIIRTNTFENTEQTSLDQAEAIASVEGQERHFIAGQIVAPAGQRIDALSLEALQELGLLTRGSERNTRILRAMLASALVTFMLSIYISRYEAALLHNQRLTLLILGGLFLVALAAARLIGGANHYLMPAAALGIVIVAISKPNLAVVFTLCFALLSGILSRSPSLEVASMFAFANLGAILTLRNAERLNSYFVAGFFAGISKAAVVTIFALQIGFQAQDASNILQALFSGLLIVPTASFAIMYGLTLVFNLPTPFKLMDLSQPSKPLLQRLLREAPGTYQHSLQVANLAEQAAEAIGANAPLTHVAALYHDIGKMSAPYFFTENQQHIHNPHEALDDPYRSADIIINHVVEGDQIAKKYRLPHRIREFIREHHGTTQVFVFYQRALSETGKQLDIDLDDFSYPGPIPQSRETAILMMADSCESAIRAVKPQTNTEILELVHRIIEGKRSNGQLNDSNLTLNDLATIEDTFAEIFRGLFHPRIDYAKEAQRSAATKPSAPAAEPSPPPRVAAAPVSSKTRDKAGPADPPLDAPTAELEEEEPLPEVPVLPKRNGSKSRQQPTALAGGTGDSV